MNSIKAIVPEEFSGKKISDYLIRGMGLTVTLVKKAKYGGVFLNGECVTMRAAVKYGDEVEVFFPEGKSENIRPIPMPLDILYEDDYIIAVNKPSGMPTHPSRGNSLPTLAEGICAYFAPKNFVFRAVNRLDRDTGGIVIIAKDTHTSSLLCKTMKAGGFSKKYDALIKGIPSPEEGVIDAPIAREAEGNIKRVVRADGKRAKTHYRVTKRLDDGNSVCEITLFTGRTHQIRVHMSYIGFPLLGDFLYGEKIDGVEYKLWAKSISFPHPYTGRMLEITCDSGL